MPRLEGIFLSIFHPLQGPRVLFQMPESLFFDAKPEASLPRTASQMHSRLEFRALSDYVIPKNALCGRMIICNINSCSDERGRRHSYKVMGFPVLLEHEQKYERNHFIFNLCFVFDARTDIHAYEPIVHKCARSLCELEEEESFVSRLDNLPRLYAIIEQLYEDLNSYYEAFVALPESDGAHRAELMHACAPNSKTCQNLTLVDPAELDELVLCASGPLARVREQKQRANERNKSSTSREPYTEERSGFQRGNQSAHRRRQSGSPNFAPQPHGLGRTVRDAINLKLFPSFANPPPVYDWHVPVLLLDINKFMNDGWDLTLVRLIPFINGINHIKRIAQMADTDIVLVKQCVQHLLYFSLAILIDIFQFSNVYVVRPQVAYMLSDPDVEFECASYVAQPGHELLPGPALWKMYSMLRYGRTVHDWVELLGVQIQAIDVRRFITFGVIKGFVRRVHQYPLQIYSEYAPDQGDASLPTSGTDTPTPHRSQNARPFMSRQTSLRSVDACSESVTGKARESQRAYKNGAMWSASHRPISTAVDIGTLAQDALKDNAPPAHHTPSPTLLGQTAGMPSSIPPELPALLDGTHCDDELCVQFGMSWPDLQRWFVQLSLSPQPLAEENLPRSDTPSGLESLVASSFSRISRMRSSSSEILDMMPKCTAKDEQQVSPHLTIPHHTSRLTHSHVAILAV